MKTDKKICVFDIQKFSVHDGPGIRTIVFMKGCPLHCQWCANPESQNAAPELMYYPDKCIGCGKCVEVCPQHATEVVEGRFLFDRSKCVNCGECAKSCYANARDMSGEYMSDDEIIREVDKDMAFYKNSGGGITFSGGEAMIYPEHVRDIARKYKEDGVSTAIETCGFVPWENYKMVMDYIDIFLFDIKMLDEKKHLKYTGGSNRQILENARRLHEQGKTVIPRMPIIPGINDSKEDIARAAKWMKANLGDGLQMHVLPYHNFGLNKYRALEKPYFLEDLKAPEDEQMEAVKAQFEEYGFDVNIGG